jgi:hypothetical protein
MEIGRIGCRGPQAPGQRSTPPKNLVAGALVFRADEDSLEDDLHVVGAGDPRFGMGVETAVCGKNSAGNCLQLRNCYVVARRLAFEPTLNFKGSVSLRDPSELPFSRERTSLPSASISSWSRKTAGATIVCER